MKGFAGINPIANGHHFTTKSVASESAQSVRSNSVASNNSMEGSQSTVFSSSSSLSHKTNVSYASLSPLGSAGAVAQNPNWLSKTLTQFKEAKNQVVQKAQKVKIPNINDS